MLSYLSDAFSWGRCVFSFPKERKAASRIVMRKQFNIVQSFTIESSFGGIDNGPRAGTLYDETIWKELGAKCGESVYHLLAADSSPLCNYVVREFALIAPSATDVAQEEDQWMQQIDVQFAEVPYNAQRDPEFAMIGNRPRPVGGFQSTALLKLRQPTTFLTANSRIISDHSPGYVAPKWVQMQFTPR
jgi:hypothetical protein